MLNSNYKDKETPDEPKNERWGWPRQRNGSPKEFDDDPPDPDEDEPTTKTSWAERMKVNRKLVPLKILMLLTHGGMAALYPYLTLHMDSIGISQVEIAFIYAVLPFVCAIGPTIGGAIADKLGNYKLVMVACIAISIAAHLLMWFGVPVLPPAYADVPVNVTNLTGVFPCGPLDVNHFLDTELLGPECRVLVENDTSMSIEQCQTNCSGYQSPHICLMGKNDKGDCFEWSNFARRSFSNLQFSNRSASNKSLMVDSFLDENQRRRTWATCVHTEPCDVTCQIQSSFTLLCNRATNASRIKSLALYVTFRYTAGIAVSTVIPVLDAIAYQMSEDYHGDLGFQRMFSLIGLCTFPPLSGYLIGVASKSKPGDYSPAFYIFGAMNLVSILVMLFMSLSIRIPAVDIMKNVGRILRNPKVFTFIVMMFLAGCAWGFLENYLFLFMKTLTSPRAPEWLYGLTSTVSGLAAIPVVAYSTTIMKYLGHTKVLMICFIFYGCRFLSYAYIYNPFHVLPVEVLEAITTSLLWVVASVYCGKIAPDYLATLQGIIGTMHYALGRGMGSLVGGIMFAYYTPRPTYKIFGVSCIVIGVVYALLHYLWLRRIPSVQVEEEEFKPDHAGITAVPSLRRGLSRREEKDIVDYAKYQGFTPLGMTFSGRSMNSSVRSAPDDYSPGSPRLRTRYQSS